MTINRTPLTDKQRAILDFVIEFVDVNSYPPSTAEVAKHFGFKSDNAAKEHLKSIEKKGYIKTTPRTARSIVILH